MRAFLDAGTGAVSYLLADEANRRAAVIDPVLDYAPQTGAIRTTSADRLLRALGARGLRLDYVLETHLHADHLTAADYLRSATGASVVIGRGLTPSAGAFDRLVGDGEALRLGGRRIRVMATPGHTACAVAYLAGDMAFVGDTLLMPDIGTGRADFPGGDARALYRSARAILDLPPATRVLVGHDYPLPPRQRRRWEASVAEQSACNVLVRQGVSEAEFVAARSVRDRALPPPALCAVAVPGNLRAGAGWRRGAGR